MGKYLWLLLALCLFACDEKEEEQTVDQKIDVSKIPVVDAHVHFFDISRPEGVPWPRPEHKALYHVTLPEHYKPIAEKNNVTKVIVVQAGDRFIDNQWNLDVTADNKDMYVVCGDLESIGTPDFKPQLENLAKDPRFVAIRILKRHAERKLFTGTIWEDLQLLSDKGITLDVLMNNHKSNFGFEEVETIAKKYPKLNIVMNHVAGYPIDGKEVQKTWAEDFKRIAQYPNVYCKVSALVERSTGRDPYRFDQEFYDDILGFLLDTFGEDRLVYGSDWPVTKNSADFAKHKKIVTDFFVQKGEKVLKKVLHDNALKAYHLN